MKAMFLAAGFGERLLPITRAVPKPLLPVLGRPLAPQVLARLATEGIEEVVVNLHHLPASLQSGLGDATGLGLRALHFSNEAERLLGTGGGIANAAPFLRGAGSFLVRNSDFLADISLAAVLAAHRKSGCLATLVVAPHRAGYTPIALDSSRRVLGFGATAFERSGARSDRFLFTGYHILEEELLERLAAGRPSDIVRELYVPLAADGRLNAFVHDGFWWEFGNPAEYLEGSRRLIELPTESRLALGDFDTVRRMGSAWTAIGPGVDLDGDGIEIAGFVVAGLGVRIGDGARLKDTAVMPEAWIGPGASLESCMVGPGAEVPAGFIADRAVIAADLDPEAPPPAGCERRNGILIRCFAATTAS